VGAEARPLIFAGIGSCSVELDLNPVISETIAAIGQLQKSLVVALV